MGYHSQIKQIVCGRKSYGLTKNELTEKYAEFKLQVQEVIEHKQFLFIAHKTWAVADIHYTYNYI